MAAAFASACLAGGRLCKKGAKCEPDPNSCMGRGTNTLYGYIVANAHDASWNGEYSPGDPIQYLDNARRYDLGGVKSRGRTLYRANSQWRLATIDQAGYAQGPLGDSAAATEWYEYGKEKKITGMYTAKTILASPKPAWTSGVACVESAKDLQYFFEKADAEHKWVVAALWRPSCTNCDWMWEKMARIEFERHGDTFFLAIDVDRVTSFMQRQPILGELPGFVIFGPDFMKKAVFSTPDADDMLRCLDRLKVAMPCDMTEVKHGDVWQPADRNPDTGYLNANYAQYTPNLVQDVGYSLSAPASASSCSQLDANNTANGSSGNATAAAPPPTRGLRRCSRRPTTAAPRCRRRRPPPRGRHATRCATSSWRSTRCSARGGGRRRGGERRRGGGGGARAPARRRRVPAGRAQHRQRDPRDGPRVPGARVPRLHVDRLVHVRTLLAIMVHHFTHLASPAPPSATL